MSTFFNRKCHRYTRSQPSADGENLRACHRKRLRHALLITVFLIDSINAVCKHSSALPSQTSVSLFIYAFSGAARPKSAAVSQRYVSNADFKFDGKFFCDLRFIVMYCCTLSVIIFPYEQTLRVIVLQRRFAKLLHCLSD